MDLGHGYLRKVAADGRTRRVGLPGRGLAVLAVGVACAAAAVFAGPGPASRPDAVSATRTPAFIAAQLGDRRAAAPVVSQPRAHARSEVTRKGLKVRLGGAAVSLSSVDAPTGDWTSYARGATRRTSYGQELVTVTAGGAEQLLQVDRHQGRHTWSWRLGTSLDAGLRKDGMVAFRAADGRDTGLRIAPVALLDVHGRQITPEHLRWSLARRDGAQFLELRLDDSSLPVPYLIDPAVTSVTFSGTSMTAGALTTWTVGFVPTSTLVSGSTITATFPSSAPTAFTVSAAPTAVLGAMFATAHCAKSSVVKFGATGVRVTLTNSGGICSLANPTAASMVLGGITNSKQSAAILATNFSVVTSLDTTAANPMGPVTIVPGAFVGLQLVVPGMTAQGGTSCGYSACPPTASVETAGTAFSATLNAVDQYGNKVTTVTDTFTLASNDPLAVLPADAPLVAGTKTFNITLKSTSDPVGNPITVTASDVTNPAKTASTTPGIAVDPLAPTQLFVYAPFTTPSVTAGTDFDVLVVAVDPYGNASSVSGDTAVSVSASGTGTVSGNTATILNGDSSVILPAVQYTKAETITMSASVTGGPALAASVPSDPPFTVSPGAATKLVMGVASSTIVNAPLAVSVTAEDAYDNVATGYTGTVHFSSTDGAATLPADYAFTGGDAGTHSFSATLKTIGSQAVSAGDGSLSVTSGPIAVAVGSASTFSLTGTPSSVAAGGTGSVTVTVRDAYGNIVTGFTGTVTFTSNDPLASLPTPYAFTGGDAGVHAFTNAYTLKTAGSRTVTVTSGAVTATTGGISVTPGPATTLAASSAGSVALGASLPVTVTAKDAYGNVATGYTGTVAVTSSDGSATLPTAHAYVAGDAGVAVFPVTFATSGSQTVTATDTGNGAVTGSTAIGVGAGAASATTSTIGASPGSITADGSSTSTITVRLKDVFGTSLAAGGDTVALSTTGGTLSAVTDNGNGTYTATLTAPSSPGSGVVSGTVNGTAVASTATVTFHVPIGPASGATSTIGASPSSIAPDGSSTSTITVQLEDAAGNNLIAGGDTVALSTTGGTLSAVTDNHDGTYTATLTSPSSPGSGVVSGTVNAAVIVSTATVTFTSAPPPPPPSSGPPVPTCVPPWRISSDGTECVPPPPPIAFLGSSPADGAAVTSLDSIALTANHMATWLSISVAGPDGTTTIPPGFGVSYSQPFTPTGPGAYTLTATMYDGYNPAQTVTVHFTVVPAVPGVALPSRSGSVTSASENITVNWAAGTFAAPAQVSVVDDPAVGGMFGSGSRAVRVTVTNLSDGTALQTFDQPLELVFDAGPAGVPSFSEDGISWWPVPKLASDVLPPGQADGYYTDSTGAVHLLTRHLTYFGVLAHKATKLVLAVTASAVRLPGAARLSMTFQVTMGARVVATLFSPHGRLVKTWSRTVPAGTSTLDLTLPASKVGAGVCTIVLRATAAGQTTRRSIRVRLG